MLRVSCRLAFFLKFPEHPPGRLLCFFPRLNKFQSRYPSATFSVLTTRLMTRTTFAIHTPTSSTPEPSRHAAPREPYAPPQPSTTVQYSMYLGPSQNTTVVIMRVGWGRNAHFEFDAIPCTAEPFCPSTECWARGVKEKNRHGMSSLHTLMMG